MAEVLQIELPAGRRRPARMGRVLSQDLRERAFAAVDCGMSCRAAAARFGGKCRERDPLTAAGRQHDTSVAKLDEVFTPKSLRRSDESTDRGTRLVLTPASAKLPIKIYFRPTGSRYRVLMTITAPFPPRSITSYSVAAVLSLLLAYGAVSLHGLVGRWGVSLDGLGVLAAWTALAALGLPLLRRPPTPRLMALLFVAAIALRLCFSVLAIDRAAHGDSQAYLTLAASLSEGAGLTIADPFLGISTRALFPPLYPVLLAGWSVAFGFSTPSLLALGTLIDVATAAMIIMLATKVGNAGAGRGGAWLYLIWPSVLFSAPLAQKEGLCAFLVLVLATAWVWDDRASLTRTAVIGVSAGLLALTQPGEAPLAALFGLVLIPRRGLVDVLRIGIPAAGVACLVLLPWWVRNWLVFKEFVPLTTSGGVGLWIGNNPGATGNWMAPPALLKGLPEIEYSHQAEVIARAWITTHPLDFARLTLTKLARSCGVGHFGLVRLYAMQPAPPAWVAATLFPLSQGAHLAMLGCAAVAARLRADRALSTVLLLVVACGLQLALFSVWFEFAERHREFATPFLLLLICAGLAPAAPADQRGCHRVPSPLVPGKRLPRRAGSSARF